MSDVQQWRRDLTSKTETARAAAAESLAQAGADAAAAAVELVQACGDCEVVQAWAVSALEECGEPPAATLPQLTSLFSSPHPLVSYWAVTLVGRLGSAATTAEAALTQVLQQNKDLATRERAVWALSQIGARSAATQTALREAAAATSAPRLARLAQDALGATTT